MLTWFSVHVGTARAQVGSPQKAAVEVQRLIAATEHGRYSEAEAGLRALAGRSLVARAWLVRVLFETGRYTLAREQATHVVARAASAERRAGAQTWIAQAWLAEGELDRGEAALRTALTTNPADMRAQVLLGRLLWDRGRRLEARRQLEPVLVAKRSTARVQRVRELCYVGMVARTLGRVHESNDAFRAAVEVDRAHVETQLEWAQLFIDKYDLKHAGESVQIALSENPRNARAQLLAARIAFLSEGEVVAARAAIARALAINPSLTSGYVLLASIALREADIPLAEAMLERALRIAPTDLEALSVRAAARFLDDDMRGFSEQEQRVLSINPHFGRFYSVVAESAEWEHRYPDVVSLQKRALKLDPDDATAHANLGLGLLRMGDEPAGLLELHEAWARDRFNVQVFNTLNLYEVSIRGDYTEFAAEGFRIRLHKTERAVLAPYLVPLLRRAYTQLHERWDFAPVGPLRVELYADRAQFSVRTTGLPNAGIQGVSFGKVVTGLSPRGGPFNWGQIVWHELSHVFHLQLSKNHVPRWFTEGLAEYETALERPEWKREDDPVLWQALRAGRLPPLAAMNRAFTQARSSEELMVAYFFAYRAVQYIVERFGFPSVRKLLVSFGEGQKLETAIVRVLGVDVRQLDREFRSALCERLAKYQREFAPDTTTYADAQAAAVLAARAPRDPDLWAALSLAELNAGHMEAAVHAADSSLKIAPSHRLAHFARARVALAQGDVSTAERSLLGIVESGADGYSLRMLLARGAFERGSIQLALQHAQAAVRFDADRPDAHKLLLELAGKLNDDTLALQALRALAELDQHDSALHIAYLAVLVRNKAWDDVIHEGETALFVAPEEPSVHFNLGQGYVEREAYARGLVELDRALALGYPKPGNVRLVRAKALLGLGRRAAALRELKQARALDEGLEQLSRALAE